MAFRLLRLGALALAAAAVIGATAPASAESVLRIKMTGDIAQIDPLATTSYPVRDMSYLVFDTLFSTDANYQIRPQMVDSYKISDDGLTYSFTLRDGLKWHDGPPVTSADCIASLERWMQKDTLGGVLKSHLASFDKVDDKTFRLILKEPWGLTLAALGKVSSYVPFMMPERLAKIAPDKANTEAIGSGPYMLKKDEWVPGQKTVYVRNPDYVPRKEPPSMMAGGKIAGVDRIERIVMPDDLSAVNALIAGEVDYIETIPPDLIKLVEKDPNIVVGARGSLGIGATIVLNFLQPPLNDVRIRQAAQYAIDQKAILQAYNGDRTDLYKICPSLLYCGGPYTSDVNSQRSMAHDPAKAKALLKEAGYDGTPLVFPHPNDQKWYDDVTTVAIQQLRAAGFVIEDKPTNIAGLFTQRTKKDPVSAGGWHIITAGWGGVDMMDPATNVFMTGACDKAWFGWACDEELQKLRAAYLAANTDADRKDIAVKLQARAQDVVPFLNGGQSIQVAAWRKNVTGIIDAPVQILWNVTKTDKTN
jgi:peptide/nickel transport system substrate-binding protein